MTAPTPQFVEELFQNNAGVYEVGGSVRDRLLGLKLKDTDLLVTHCPLDSLIQYLKKHGAVKLVGKSFGILKFHPRENPERDYDIALPRKEISTGIGHRDFDVLFDPEIPIEDDLSRRDFTINAMAMDLKTQKIVDPFHGQGDLERRLLRMVHSKAFEEDPLRLMRAIQFTSRFGLKIEPETLKAMTDNAEKITTVSSERIIEEVRKLFLATKPSSGFRLMLETGLLKEIFPELQSNVGVEQGNKGGLDVFEHTLRVLDAAREDPANASSGDLELMFAALYHDVGKAKTQRFDGKKNRVTFYGHQFISERMVKRRFEKLKTPTIGVDPERVAVLVKHHMFQAKSYFSEKAIRRFIKTVSPELILKLVDLRLTDNRGGKYPEGIHGVLKLRKRIEEELSKKPPFRVQDLAINGHDLMGLGVQAGPSMGAILKNLVEVVLDDPQKNTQEILLKIVKENLL